MNLDEFISTTLISITVGLKNANEKINGGDVTFRMLKGYDNDKKNQGFIDFDVAVTASNKSGKEAKAGLYIKVVELGGSINKSSETSNISRIKFSISANKELH